MSASRSEIPRAVEAFRSAIERDPYYAAAHAGLAVAHCAEAELRLVAPDVAYQSARAAALRALAMEASNADAQVALGTVCSSATGTGMAHGAASSAHSS